MYNTDKNIILDNIGIEFDSGLVVDKFSHQFEKGKIYSILGPSGCGKSTLLRCIAGLQKQTVGDKYLNNKKYYKPNKDIYMVDQRYVNFPWLGAYENVVFSSIVNKEKDTPERYAKAAQIMNSLGLHNHNLYPHEMSGGMNQRLALARLIYANPPIVLLDEPTSALDEETTKVVMNTIKWMNKEFGTTFIIVTHNESLADSLSRNIIRLPKIITIGRI